MKLEYHEQLSIVAFTFNLHRYNKGFYLAVGEAVEAVDMYVEGDCLSTLHAAKLICDGEVDCMAGRCRLTR